MVFDPSLSIPSMPAMTAEELAKSFIDDEERVKRDAERVAEIRAKQRKSLTDHMVEKGMDESTATLMLDGMDEAEIEDALAEMAAERASAPSKADAKAEVVDIGSYCTECRDDTTGDKERVPNNQPAEGIRPSDGKFGPIILAGFLCGQCKPFAHPLSEALVRAMAERRYDPAEVRRALRAIGEEEMWGNWISPMLDVMEAGLGLEKV